MKNRSSQTYLRIAIIGAVFIAVALTSYFLPIKDLMQTFIAYIKNLGAAGIVFFGILYIVATIVMLPALILTLGAGLLYGPWLGTLIVSFSSVIGATLAFLLGRHFLKTLIASKLEHKHFRAIDRAIKKDGAKIVLLLRLSPLIPFNLLNYGLSLTSVSLRQYVVASFLGMLPLTFLYVYAGSLIESIVDLGHVNVTSNWHVLIYWGGLIVTLMVIMMLTNIARRTLREALMENQSSNVKTPAPINLRLMPDDTYNQKLLANVHPNNYQNPKPASYYNLVVIGGGSAGLVSAAGARGLFAKVALVERQFMGGDCLNFGCVPSKGILRPAHFLSQMRQANLLGITHQDYQFDFSHMMREMRKIRAEISHHDSVQRFSGLGIDVFLGHGRFINSHALDVDGQVINFNKAIIATGARPRVLDIEGAHNVSLHTRETIFSLTTLPKRLLVIGAGPIGCEIAQAFRSFGSMVTVVEILDHILPKDDLKAVEVVVNRMKKDGIIFELSTNLVKIEEQDGQKVVHGRQGDKDVIFTADEVFCALGQTANIDDLDLERAGIAQQKSGLVVNDYLQTTNKNVFAAGDVCSKFQFTHAADAMARIAIQNALFFGRKRVSQLVIPWCTYTNPELAHVGLSLPELEKEGFTVDTITVPMSDIDRAQLDRTTDGFLKVHYDKSSGAILAATAVGIQAGDLINMVAIAITNKLTLAHISKTIFSYPTTSEVFKRAADAYNRTRLTPWIALGLKKFMQWRRL